MQAPSVRLSTPSRCVSTGVVLFLALLLSTGCDDQDSAGLPIWTPTDHDNQASPAAGQTDTTAPRPRMPELEQHGIDDVVLATWKQNCTTCHGLIGRGDGPQGPMFRPPDLTSNAFQERAIDSEILYTIEKGRGRMPAFGHLPKDTIQGLLRLVRMLGAPKPAATGTPGPTSQPPAGHPPVGTQPTGPLPPGHPPTGARSTGQPSPAAPPLPPGHP